MKVYHCVFYFLVCFYLTQPNIYAQGDGPRAELFAPTGVWGVNPKYLHLEQNLLPAGNILVEGANFEIDVLPISFFHTYGIGNNYARVLALVNPGSGKATANINPQIPEHEETIVLNETIKHSYHCAFYEQYAERYLVVPANAGTIVPNLA